MQRCLQLAQQAIGYAAPNPVVGAVLVHNDVIIAEGYHRQYGKAHAEVNCIAAVKKEHLHLIRQSTLYVSLEPCAHWGKTPPCADLIIDKEISNVVVGCRDPFAEVNGKGIDKLMAAGVQVTVGILEAECKELNKRFFTFHQQQRPYIILKWAQSLDNKIAGNGAERVFISEEAANRLVHKWRSEEAAIMIGTNTALSDDPQLGTRLWPGKNPVRIVLDSGLRLPTSLKVFDGTIPTYIFNTSQHSLPINGMNLEHLSGVHYYQLKEDSSIIQEIVEALYQLNIQSVLVEGGARLLQSFIDSGLWDEARVITNDRLVIGDGVLSPQIYDHQLTETQLMLSDTIRFYKHTAH